MMNKNKILASVSILFLCLLMCGCGEQEKLIVIGSADNPETEGTLVEEVSVDEGRAEDAEVSEQEMPILVYVCGAVMNPGVVEIPAGSRVEDALAAAGGFSLEAARNVVNLADWVTDGQMLYFPTEAEAQESRRQEALTAAGLVNINTADVSALCTLPGVGESRAADIIAYREQNGGFRTCEDIMEVPGIKTSVYEKIRDKITVE